MVRRPSLVLRCLACAGARRRSCRAARSAPCARCRAGAPRGSGYPRNQPAPPGCARARRPARRRAVATPRRPTPRGRAGGRCSRRIVPSHSSTARMATLRSSRMLPGQRVPPSSVDARPPRARGGRAPRARAPTGARTARASAAISSGRSRSGGIVERDAVEPEVEVLAERPARDLGVEVAVGRGDEADVDRPRLAPPPTRSDLALLEHAQQLGLHRQRQLADLVEEHGAAVARSRAGRAWPRPRR